MHMYILPDNNENEMYVEAMRYNFINYTNQIVLTEINLNNFVQDCIFISYSVICLGQRMI